MRILFQISDCHRIVINGNNQTEYLVESELFCIFAAYYK